MSAAKREYAATVKAIATQAQPPLFKQRPPRWIRWVWLGVAADLIFFSNSAILTWNHWTDRAAAPPAPDTPNAAPEAAAESQPKWELRPTWQRAGLCAVFIASGCGIAGGILHARSRVIRALTLTPRTFEISAQPKKPRQLLFMQTFDHKETGGFLIPLRICSLREGRRPSQLLVQIEGRRGAWELNLEDATIDGTPSIGVTEARKAFLDEWKGGKLIGTWATDTNLENRWKSGPVTRGKKV